MKSIIIILSLWFASCSPAHLNETGYKIGGQKAEKYQARITYYSVGEDKWGDLVACPKTPRAKQGITVAAHPSFKFGTKIYIPKLKNIIGNGIFIVQDRGSAVTSKKASGGRTHVFDVFVKTKSIMKKHANKNNMYMDVYVFEE